MNNKIIALLKLNKFEHLRVINECEIYSLPEDKVMDRAYYDGVLDAYDEVISLIEELEL